MKAVGNVFATIGVAQKNEVAHVCNETAWVRSSMPVQRRSFSCSRGGSHMQATHVTGLAKRSEI